jgi:hypothetical protein
MTLVLAILAAIVSLAYGVLVYFANMMTNSSQHASGYPVLVGLGLSVALGVLWYFGG